MKILIIPLLLIFLPITVLFLTIKYWKKDKKISIGQKIVLGIVFFILGLIATVLAMIVSAQGHGDNGIRCATGVITFIPMSLFVNFIGIPVMLVLEKTIRKRKKE
jgi:hypothetical protein